MTELFRLERGSHFKLLEAPQVPPDCGPVSLDTVYRLHNIDGMYSYVTCKELDHPVHFACWTEVEVVDNE